MAIIKTAKNMMEEVSGDYDIFSGEYIATSNSIEIDAIEDELTMKSATSTNVEGKNGGVDLNNFAAPTPIETIDEVPFLVHFRRCANYKGEYGFDWMRDDYKDICNLPEFPGPPKPPKPREPSDSEAYKKRMQEYEERKKEYEERKKSKFAYKQLKKEYTPIKIGNVEYFVPWLSIYPPEKDKEKVEVKDTHSRDKASLTLEVQSLVEWKTSNISFECPNDGCLSVEPKTLTITKKGIEKDIKEGKKPTIEITCIKPITSNSVVIKVMAQKKDSEEKVEVGRLNIIKNNIEYKLPIRFIKVLGDGDTYTQLNGQIFPEKDKTKKGVDFQENEKLDKKYFKELKDYIKYNSLNQALITPIFEEGNTMRELYIDFSKLGGDIINNNNGQPQFLENKKKLVNILKERQAQEFDQGKPFNGIIVYMTIIHTYDTAGAFAYIVPLNEFSVIVPDGTCPKEACVHEMGHALGLLHSFENADKNIIYTDTKLKNLEGTNIIKEKAYKIECEAEQTKYLNDDPKKMINDTLSVSEYRKILENNIKITLANIDILENYPKKLQEYKMINLSYVFEQAKTDNIMDYDHKDGETQTSNHTLICFSKPQWLLMKKIIDEFINKYDNSINK